MQVKQLQQKERHNGLSIISSPSHPQIAHHVLSRTGQRAKQLQPVAPQDPANDGCASPREHKGKVQTPAPNEAMVLPRVCRPMGAR